MKLKPCPFCGGDAELWCEEEEFWFATCHDCCARAGGFTDHDRAINAWNQRHNEPPTVDEVPNLDSQRRENC